MWLYNPRMEPLRHGFEEPGDEQDIRVVVDTSPTLAWSAGPDGSALTASSTSSRCFDDRGDFFESGGSD
jgi:hypothetical protein